MFQKLLLKLAKGALEDLLDDALTKLVVELKEEIDEMDSFSVEEKKTAHKVADLVAARASKLIDNIS
jgi:hypothetical protein